MWLSIIVLSVIFMAFGYFLNEIVRTVVKELEAVGKEFNNEYPEENKI